MSFVITIDGPAGAGKSTTARAVADRLGFLYVDTGALYRALAFKVLSLGLSAEDEPALERCAQETRLGLAGTPGASQVWLDGVEVGGEIRTPAVSEMSSRLAARPGIRRQLVELQRSLRVKGPLVAEGRDLGTVVFPDAEVKIYLDADHETRVKRRHQELVRRGLPVQVEDVAADLQRRDERDRLRADSPLVAAPDAVLLDTSGMSAEQQVTAVLELARKHPRFPHRAADAREAG